VHQDQRIGLALAVLLVGAAGAFFFRNETSTEPVPRLKSAEILDSQIAEKSVSPYIQTQEPDREESPRGALPEERDVTHLESPSFLDGSEIGSIPFPESGAIPSPGSRTAAPSRARTHTVQKGETLSSIAARTLGSANRFQDLFDANRDQLKDANDLKIGMTLRIPEASTAENAGPSVPTPLEDAATISDAGSADAAPQKRFESPRRLPLGVRGTPSSPLLEPTARPVRKLSQTPPADPDGKVAR